MSGAAEPLAPVIDLRTYKLRPGAGSSFDQILRNDALPLLAQRGIDVVGYGPSLDDSDLYHLVRAFPSAAARNERLEAFYGSGEWQSRHSAEVQALIDNYHTLLIPACDVTRRAYR